MTYSVKEIFYTLQGEGAQTGRPAVFCRFAGCNLWTGRENDRAKAVCKFCDTDFVGGTKYLSADGLADAVLAAWSGDIRNRFVVVTGGEPSLQYDKPLADALRDRHFFIAMETNGTVPLKAHVDWLTVSPKADSELAVTDGDELKLIYPQKDAPPKRFEAMPFGRFYLQPMDMPRRQSVNTLAAIEYCRAHPQWRLSLQTHKLVGFP